MTALIIETLLLMVSSYVLGAALACVVRRALFAATARVPVIRRVDPLPEVLQSHKSSPRFGRSAAETRLSQVERPVAAVVEAEDLKRIYMIDAILESRLNKLGVLRYEQIANWMQPDVARISRELGIKGRINQENWIEQAQILAKRGETHFAQQRALVTLASGMGEDRTDTRAAKPLPEVAERAAFAQSTPSNALARGDANNSKGGPAATLEAAAVPIRPMAQHDRDDLRRISGIDAETEQRLNALGVTRYSQIANWSSADLENFDRQIGGDPRIARENWVEQAQILGRGGDTVFSREFDRRGRGEAPPTAPRPVKLPDAIRENALRTSGPREQLSSADLGSLRSMRSEGNPQSEPGPEAAVRAAGQNKIVRSEATGDLKRIRGIGVRIEKRLKAMGIVSYEQIANWTAADVDRVSQLLDFKGCIERENWIEQARILASGGATEFSRRVDRGEVETSRAPS